VRLRKIGIRERLGLATAGIGMQSNTGRSRPQGRPCQREKGFGWHGRGRVVVSLVAHRLNDAVDEGDRRVLTKS
jgi:hypothetical protein